jgi:chaperone modulatory protein CbpM
MSDAHTPWNASLPVQPGVLTLDELCRVCAVQTGFVLAMLDEGVIEPQAGQAPESWRFSETQVRHVTVAWRLQRDLGVNFAGVALALQLLDEVQTLRAQLAASLSATDDLA